MKTRVRKLKSGRWVGEFKTNFLTAWRATSEHYSYEAGDANYSLFAVHNTAKEAEEILFKFLEKEGI